MPKLQRDDDEEERRETIFTPGRAEDHLHHPQFGSSNRDASASFLMSILGVERMFCCFTALLRLCCVCAYPLSKKSLLVCHWCADWGCPPSKMLTPLTIANASTMLPSSSKLQICSMWLLLRLPMGFSSAPCSFSPSSSTHPND